MKKIKKLIKKLIKKWKAAGVEARENNNNPLANAWHFKVIGLQAALEIIEDPANKEKKVCRCDETTYQAEYICRKCGGHAPDEV